MSTETQQIAVLLAFAMTLMFANLKSGATWLKFLTLWGMIACFGGAAWLTVEWVVIR